MTVRQPFVGNPSDRFQQDVRRAIIALSREIEASGGGIDLFSATEDGIVPASGGGTTNFLRADGTWAAPKGGGTATPIYTLRTGANNSTADTSRLVITGPAQTAVADTAFFKAMYTVRSVGASGVIQGLVWVQHNLAATGFANTPAGFSLVQATSAGFDNSALGGLFVSLTVNPGASGAWVTDQVFARAWY